MTDAVIKGINGINPVVIQSKSLIQVFLMNLDRQTVSFKIHSILPTHTQPSGASRRNQDSSNISIPACRSVYQYPVQAQSQLQPCNHLWQSAQGIHSYQITPLRNTEPFLTQGSQIKNYTPWNDSKQQCQPTHGSRLSQKPECARIKPFMKALEELNDMITEMKGKNCLQASNCWNGQYHRDILNHFTGAFSITTIFNDDERGFLIKVMNDWYDLMPEWSLSNLVSIATDLNNTHLLLFSQASAQIGEKSLFSHLLECAVIQCEKVKTVDSIIISHIAELLKIVTLVLIRHLQLTYPDLIYLDRLWGCLPKGWEKSPDLRKDQLLYFLAHKVSKKKNAYGCSLDTDIQYTELLLKEILLNHSAIPFTCAYTIASRALESVERSFR